MNSIVLIAHNLRSTHNVGSLLRTAEGLGVDRVWLTGYTPYPLQASDVRMPYIAQKLHAQIHKTALGAEELVSWQQSSELFTVLTQLKSEGYTLAALEQHPKSIKLSDYKPPNKIALIVGREVEGIEPEVLAQCDVIIEIPMKGQKESFNVVQAAAMALYSFIFL
jgi:23S rRNA (guanosine2251-2'-O)-methyltransferase